MTRLVAFAMVLLFLVPIGLADQPAPAPAPTSAAAVNALAKFRREVADADRQREKAVADARAALVADLKAAQKAALAHGNQDEALAVAATIKEAESVDRPKLIESGPPPKLVGTWDYSGGGSLTYDRFGMIKCSVWNGSVGRWRQVDAMTFVQREPNGGDVTITLTTDGKRALWVYQDGRTATAVRK